MGLSLVNTKKMKLADITFYSKEALEILVLQYQMMPEDIVEHYGLDEAGKIAYPLKRVIQDLNSWNIQPHFIHGYDVVDNMRKSIREYDITLKKYTKNGEARYPDMIKVISLLEQIRDKLQHKPNLEALKELLEDFLRIDISFVEMEKLKQSNEKTRQGYFKLRQDENKNLMAALKIQTEAIEQEAFLTSTVEELKLLDIQNKTNYAQYFIANVKDRMTKKLNDTRILGRGSVEDLKKKVEKKLKPVDTKAKENKEFKINVDKIAADYDVHYQTAQIALTEWRKSHDENGNPTKELAEFIPYAKERANKIYRYIGPDGKKILKQEENNNEVSEDSITD